jgi:bacterioferritin-associated ferredoxin
MYICLCNAITERQIIRAAEEGARSAQDLAQDLGVGSGCGRCVSCAKALLFETVARMACGGDCSTCTASSGETA